ncbi:hypothetical protein HY380_00940, partial [Candidatus Saccharibacteria bacterium]|nr:hypothetical protein [Candidatus Saccharibacteria bacterium]
ELSDDLSLPLLQIKTTLEVLGARGLSPEKVRLQSVSLKSNAENGLQLIEAYRMALHTDETSMLDLESVAMAAVLNEAAHQLEPYAKNYATKMEVDIIGRFAPVLAHKASLVAALQCLGASLVRAQAAQRKRKNYRVILGAHRSTDGLITTGVFSNARGLSDQTLRAARGLVGRARQPFPALPAGSASGVLIADMLCSAMWQPLRQAAHRQMSGLATAVPLSKQLQFM